MPDTTPQRIDDLASLREIVAGWRRRGERVALVPTMGALHAGHVALVERGRALCERVIVSIFVNPTQFAPNEDLSRYPRDIEADIALLGQAGADAAWLPAVETMYPTGFCTWVEVSGLTAGLCGAVRPGHFTGVATVVTKLFGQVRPDAALFGEKDFQQLRVIQQAAADLDLGIEVVGGPTVREADGLALSSRNRYLSPEERAKAPRLHAVLADVAAHARYGAAVAGPVAAGTAALEAAGFSVQYLAVCDAVSLAPVERVEAPGRVFAAAYLGRTRLIDNVPV